MHRDKLVREVKEEYTRLADSHRREDFIEGCRDEPGEAYFERLLQMVINAIEEGRFDRFMNGRQIMEAVANDRERWGIVA